MTNESPPIEQQQQQQQQRLEQQQTASAASWVRGVNLGGWLVLERFITPYLFAVTSCHIRGDFCWYPGQLSAPPAYTACDPYACKPHLLTYPTTVAAAAAATSVNLQNITDAVGSTTANATTTPPTATTTWIDYPADAWTLMSSFDSPKLAAGYLNVHYEHFLTFDHLKRLKEQGGVSYVRVPLPHWILQNDSAVFDSFATTTTTNNSSSSSSNNNRLNVHGEPYVAGNMWSYFRRMVQWCDELNIQVWPDLHTAPGSQNGFDNSGQWNQGEPTCQGWAASSTTVNRTLDLLQGIVQQIAKDNMTRTVTGFGILNEPFKDCLPSVMQEYNQRAIQIVKRAMGPATNIYIADNFNATLWNHPTVATTKSADAYWNDNSSNTKELYENTFLDSHYYHVFAEEPRALSPRQHIAYVCRYNARYTTSCCYDTPSPTMLQRMIGEWSAAYDTLPSAKLQDVMLHIRVNKTALDLNRVLTKAEQDFLKNFVHAQMVTYEAADHYKNTNFNNHNNIPKNAARLSRGWFYWTFQMEGGAFAEWDFMRGIKEGWIPKIPPPDVTSTSLYGTCESILFRTSDDVAAVIHEFPDPATLPKNNWQGVQITDDLVVSHGNSALKGNTPPSSSPPLPPLSSPVSPPPPPDHALNSAKDIEKSVVQHGMGWFPYVAIAFFTYAIWRVFCRRRERDQYMQIDV